MLQRQGGEACCGNLCPARSNASRVSSNHQQRYACRLASLHNRKRPVKNAQLSSGAALHLKRKMIYFLDLWYFWLIAPSCSFWSSVFSGSAICCCRSYLRASISTRRIIYKATNMNSYLLSIAISAGVAMLVQSSSLDCCALCCDWLILQDWQH